MHCISQSRTTPIYRALSRVLLAGTALTITHY